MAEPELRPIGPGAPIDHYTMTSAPASGFPSPPSTADLLREAATCLALCDGATIPMPGGEPGEAGRFMAGNLPDLLRMAADAHERRMKAVDNAINAAAEPSRVRRWLDDRLHSTAGRLVDGAIKFQDWYVDRYGNDRGLEEELEEWEQ